MQENGTREYKSMIECERWSTGNCARDYNLTILTNSTCTN